MEMAMIRVLFQLPRNKQDHKRREARGDERFAQDALNRGAHENGLVEEVGDIQTFRKGRLRINRASA